ncbi:MAG: transcription elongation factor GreA [Ectothiorhodospiraceae bacterium]|nr:transcription elongation factor GreA [Ectothiorhodospiraceae bacterium]
MTGKVPLTAEGAEKMRVELRELKNVVRPRIVAAIATAREHGDLKENAEYHAAREQQSFTEGRIADLSGKLSHAQIIDIKEIKPTGKIIFGVTVGLVEEETGNEVTYQIVGEDEADLKVGKISVTSPIARALIGKEEGDVAEVRAPGGIKEYEILDVKHV